MTDLEQEEIIAKMDEIAQYKAERDARPDFTQDDIEHLMRIVVEPPLSSCEACGHIRTKLEAVLKSSHSSLEGSPEE